MTNTVEPITDEAVAGVLVSARMILSSRHWPEFEKRLATNVLKLHARLSAVEAENEKLREALEAADTLCNEALPKFNWGKSALDANAIRLLNEVPGMIRNALTKEKNDG